MSKRFAIIGAGNGGQAFAAYLSLKGHTVKIYDVFQETVDKLNELGGVKLEGKTQFEGFGKIELASTNLEEVVTDTDMVMIVLPSIYHADITKKMAPFLKDGQILFINPAAGLGLVAVKKALEDSGCTAKVKLGCSSTLLFACRAVSVGHVSVSGEKTTFTAAALPETDNAFFTDFFKDTLPQFNFNSNAITVSLDNLNAVVHPGPTLLYTGNIEGKNDFMYYKDFTPTQGKLAEAIDAERMAIAEALGQKVQTTVDAYIEMYPTHGKNVYEVIVNNPGYDGIKGQKRMDTRYILEDIPYALEAFKTMAQIGGVKTPCIDAIITLARTLVDGIEEGRTAKSLGIENMSKDEFLKMCLG